MIFYLCNGQIPRCCQDANCLINSPLGSCRHTVDAKYAKHQELADEKTFKEALEKKKFKQVKFGPVMQYWEQDILFE